MIKLLNIIESFPATIEYRIREFKSRLKPGKIIVKKWGHLSHTDELHMYLGDNIYDHTIDYSNIADSEVTIVTMKIGEIAHDTHLGIYIDFALDEATLIPGVVTLDREWRFLKPDEVIAMKEYLSKSLDDPTQENNSNEKDRTQTCQQVIEKFAKHKIIL
jgi:hypothetical protein